MMEYPVSGPCASKERRYILRNPLGTLCGWNHRLEGPLGIWVDQIRALYK
jgi:hypothetical protein